MANAKIVQRPIVERKLVEVITERHESSVHLELSMEEAIALRSLTNAVAGLSEATPRKFTDAIANVLSDAGVRSVPFAFSTTHAADDMLDLIREAATDA